MRVLPLLILLLHGALQPAPPDPRLSAYWDGPGAATISWTQTTRGCLYRQSAIGEVVFIGCYEDAGEYTISLGRIGPLSGDLRPTAGDVFVLQIGPSVYRAPLVARAQYLPAFRA